MRLIFIEGVPGSGKSTIAEKLCADGVKYGLDAKWYLEESHDHPVHPKPWRALNPDNNFVEECLRSWSAFLKKAESLETIHILEGSAFQSTIRFMMEKGLPGIDSYYRRFEEIVSVLEPRMVYFRPPDVVSHSRYICVLRGSDWSTKVSGYLSQTNYSIRHELGGLEGMHRFWDEYAKLCDKFVARTSIQTNTIEFLQGEWERHMAEASTFLGWENAANTLSEKGPPRIHGTASTATAAPTSREIRIAAR